LVLKAFNAEQETQESKRDLELKDVKIESLSNIIKKRGFGDTKTLQLETDKEQLVVDNKLLLRENGNLQAKLADLENSYGRKQMKQSHDEINNQKEMEQQLREALEACRRTQNRNSQLTQDNEFLKNQRLPSGR